MKVLLFTSIIVSSWALEINAQGHKYVRDDQEQHRVHEAKHKSEKHVHDADTPDPQEEARELKKRQRQAKHGRTHEMIKKDKENLKYEKKRLKSDHSAGTGSYDAISKAGVRQHKRKLKEDKKKSTYY